MKILVVIVNYGKSQLKYLERMIEEFQSMVYDVDIVVHSNIPLNYKGVEVKIEMLDDYEKLPFSTRKTIFDNRNDYDLFIYSENDHLFTPKHIESFLKVTELLPKQFLAGFLQYEKYDNRLFYPGYHIKFGWNKKILFKIGNYKFAHFTNVHQGSFIITKNQLYQVLQKFDFLHQTLKQRYSILYRKLLSFKYRYRLFYKQFLYKFENILNNRVFRYLLELILKSIDILNQIYFSNYSAKCRAGTDIYTHGGFIKVIPITHLNDFSIHHMPNIYKGQLGVFEDQMNKEVKELIEMLNHR